MIQRHLPPPARLPDTIPTFITPSVPPSITPVWEHVIAVLMKMPPTTAEGQNMRIWVLYHSLTYLENFLIWNWILSNMMPSQSFSLLWILPSLIPWFLSNTTPLGISSCSGSTSTTWFKTPTSLLPQMPQIMP